MNAFLLGRLMAFGGLMLAVPGLAQTLPEKPSAQQQKSATGGAGAVVQKTEPYAIRVLLSPELETTLVSQMPGRISTLNASLGAPVARGKIIVAMDCSELTARQRMAEAEYAAAREVHRTKTRLRELDAAGEHEVALAAAGSDKAKAAIALARAQADLCNVAAPFSGRIAKIHVKPHQGVNVGTPLVELLSDGPLKLRLNVPSLLLRSLHVGTSFEVDIDETGKTYPARVTAINSRVDAVAQSVELEARIDGRSADLLAGMSGVARLNLAR